MRVDSTKLYTPNNIGIMTYNGTKNDKYDSLNNVPTICCWRTLHDLSDVIRRSGVMPS